MEGVIMDSERFDHLVRSVGQTRSRRDVLQGLGKGLGAAALATVGLSHLDAAEARRRRRCPTPSSTSSYQATCTNVSQQCTAGENTLSATCRAANGAPTPTSIIVNSCKPQHYYIANCNGILHCGEC
jgi:hypothetical protein